MKSALKALAIIWLCISVLSLAGLLYLLLSYGIVGAFAGAFKTSGDAELTRWFLCELGLTVGILREHIVSTTARPVKMNMCGHSNENRRIEGSANCQSGGRNLRTVRSIVLDRVLLRQSSVSHPAYRPSRAHAAFQFQLQFSPYH
jgi:hypothetical protein